MPVAPTVASEGLHDRPQTSRTTPAIPRDRPMIVDDLRTPGPEPHERHRVTLFGVKVDTMGLEETVRWVDRRLLERAPTLQVDLNASKIVLVQSDEKLRGIVMNSDLVSADGQSVVWASRLLGKPVAERVSGIDLMTALLALARERGYSVFFLGARQETLEHMTARLKGAYPGLRLAGLHHGYFGEQDGEAMASLVHDSRAQMLFVGMPTPRKEYWLADHFASTGALYAMGVGGSFDVLAGQTPRAPRWMQRTGLEWLYRLAQEPRRLWRRYLFGNLRFLILVAKEVVRARIRVR